MKRRQFIKRLLQTTALAATPFSVARVLGANDRVRVGWIGCGGRGRLVAGLMRSVLNVEFVAVCDVYDMHRAAAQEWVGSGCQSFRDFRKVLELKDVDAVLLATPDHWHAIPCILACQAGKDVYVEKPLAHNIREGQAMVAAAQRSQRIVQVGTQQRSAPHYAEVARIIQSGELGPVHFVRIWNYLNQFPDGVGQSQDSDPPEGVDWDMYLGPAPYVRFNKNRFVGTYRWFWDYAGGLITDYGVHRFDSLHQVMGADSPSSVTAVGQHYEIHDGRDTPDVVQATYEYPKFLLSYEAFYGTNGTLFSNRLGFEICPELNPASRGNRAAADADRPRGFRMTRHEMTAQDATGPHVKNFIECVRSRRKPVAPPETGHRATVVAHLGNIAYRTGHKIRWDAARQEILDDPEASRLLGRQARKPWDLI
jgi:predicted dehydrogenase